MKRKIENAAATFTPLASIPAGEEMAILPRAELDRLRALAAGKAGAASDAREMAEDVAAYDRAKERGGPVLTQDQMNRILAGESALRVWREATGKTQGQLAADAGVSQSYIADLEAGRKEGGIQLWRRIADALGCDLDDLA